MRIIGYNRNEKERFYENDKKTEHPQGKKGKLLTAVLALALCFSLSVCGANAEKVKTEESAGMPNPVVEYGTLEEINEKIGVNLLAPSDTGVSNESFSVISNSVAQYVCDFKGKEWTFRAACITDEDISGMYSEYNEFVSGQDSGLYTNEFYLFRFFDGGKQYTIVVTDPVSPDGEIIINEGEFMDVCMELECIQKLHLDDPLVGDYQDTVSQRASAYVERFGEVYNISVNWSSSADTFNCWTMYDAVRDGDKLTYCGEEIGQYTYDEEGNETSADVTVSNNLGFFEIKDGMLYWTGAAQNECRLCVFEKIIYEE